MVCPSQRTIGQGIRRFVALLLSFALPGACLPVDSMHLVGFRAGHTRSQQMLLPQDGLDAFSKVPGFSGRTSPAVENPRTTASYSSLSANESSNLLRAPAGMTAGSAGVVPYLSSAPGPPPPSKRIRLEHQYNHIEFQRDEHCRGQFHLV